jgi:hypothetical protein
MRHAVLLGVIFLGSAAAIHAQEAESGIGLRATLTTQALASNELTEAPRSGAPIVAGGRAMVYPTIKFNRNLYVTAALQAVTRPYYFDDLSTTGYGAYGRVLQATLNYSRVSQRGSVLLRAGQMSSAFGSFLLRYDDLDNPLVGLPPGYGYYYAPVALLGVAGAQVDVTRGRVDGRLQFASSSPANPRSIFAGDQYGNWAGGGGYTIRQGLRVGVSGYRGPYLDRHYAFFTPGEANPNTLPAHAMGIDADWARGHTHVWAELQRFVMPYTAIPTFRESTAYADLKHVLGPRWFVAGRYGYTSTSATGIAHSIETAVAFRPNRLQLVKAGYQEQLHSSPTQPDDHRFAIQLITSFDKSFARSQ